MSEEKETRIDTRKHAELSDEQTEYLNELIKSWRESHELTGKQVAENMATPQSTVSRIEHNAGNMRISTLLRYAKACGMDKITIKIY